MPLASAPCLTRRASGDAEATFELTENLSGVDLVNRRALLKKLFADQNLTTTIIIDGEPVTIQDPHLATDWLQEIFFFVPMAIALHLQRSSEFLAALDWYQYQTVYAYTFTPDQRKIYRGLEMEDVFPDGPRITPDIWLRKELQPHFLGRQRRHAYSRFTILSIVQCLLDCADSEFAAESSESLLRARTLYLTALNVLAAPEMPVASPFVPALRQHADLNLEKLRSGRNIAGLERPARATAGAEAEVTIVVDEGLVAVSARQRAQPSAYRYTALIGRAKELAAIAQQMEAAYLSALEKRDGEAYTLLQAGHDLQLSQAAVQLQQLRLTEASASVDLAGQQKDRAQLQSETFQEFIDAGLNDWERTLLKKFEETRDTKIEAAKLQTMASSIKGWLGGDVLGTLLNVQGLSAALSALKAETAAQMASVHASDERRRQEWRFQKALADQDVAIGAAQVDLALKQKDIVAQEGLIAGLQADHAEVTVNFLANKFTNAELYEWMSGVLGRVYSYFLQQATSIAQLAQNQLAVRAAGTDADHRKERLLAAARRRDIRQRCGGAGSKRVDGLRSSDRGHTPSGPLRLRDQPAETSALADVLTG